MLHVRPFVIWRMVYFYFCRYLSILSVTVYSNRTVISIKKHVVIILDGCADLPQAALGGRTPLMAAKTPNLDAMAKRGLIGRANTIPQNIAPGSDTGILSIFGYDPRVYYTGRSPLEAAGAGVALRPGNLSFRLNLAAVDGDGAFEDKTMRSHSGGNIEGEQATELMGAFLADGQAKALLDRLKMAITVTPTFRHVAVMADTPGEMETAPPHEIVGEAIGGYLPKGAASDLIRALMRRSYEVLDGHPINVARRAGGRFAANCAWLWGQGGAVELPSFEGKYGKRAAVVTAVPLVKGIGRLAGAEIHDVATATGDINTDYAGKARAAASALKDGADCVFVHVEAPDECSHDGDLAGKITAIERIDALLIPVLREALGNTPARWLALADHYTLLSTRGHNGTPVPFLIYDSAETDGGADTAFDEPSAADGPLIDPATELMGMLFKG